MQEELKKSVQYFPDKPGVYIMKNRSNAIIYVGKAKSLKKRVGSYFSKHVDRKTEFLLRKVHSIEPIITENEYEALLLENTLIKEHQPHYNINLKDGKTYPMIRVTNEEYPRVFRTRRLIQDGSDYYGPYTDVSSIDLYLDLIEKLFPLRKCKGKLKKRNHPCLYYHIDRCSAPCCGKIDKTEYLELVEKVKKLLVGETGEIIGELHQKMQEATEKLEYEKAAGYRDSIQAIRRAEESQRVVDFDPEIRDYIAYELREQLCTFTVFKMREGKLIGRDVFRTEVYGKEEEALQQFLMRYYSEIHTPPARIYTLTPFDIAPFKAFFKEKTERDVEIEFPSEGPDYSVLKMARENSIQDMENRFHKKRIRETLEGLKTILQLPTLPRRIEGFDISQLAGKYPVASMVSFHNGEPDKKNYRHFHMKSLRGAIDDYEAMREVVARRYTRVINENLERPNLILIDGGRGQVHAAFEILQTLGVEDIPVFGLAKQREEIVPVEGDPIILDETSAARKLLQHVRDESHRFATTFHTKLRKKDVAFSRLEQIPGIGKQRSRSLLEQFGSISNIVSSTPEEIAEKCSLSKQLAEKVLNALRGTEDARQR